MAQLLSLDPTNVNAPNQPTYQMAPPDISGLIQNNYQTESANNNAMLGGLSGLGVAGIFAASDRRLKHNLVPRGTHAIGVPVYEFSYNGSDDRYIGVMAQDLLEVMPEAVVTMDNGFYAVNYGML